MATPEQRACLDFAYRHVMGMGIEEEIYVFRDGKKLTFGTGIEPIKSSHPLDVLLVFLAKAMQAHLRGVDLAQARNDLLAGNVSEVLADKVHNHLISISVNEWQRLRERVAFYAADDSTGLLIDPTEIEG